MKVHHDEGVAIHIDPEPCAGLREDDGEASVGERTGQPLSRERSLIPGADAVDNAEGDADGCVSASARTARRGRRPSHGDIRVNGRKSLAHENYSGACFGIQGPSPIA